MTSQHASLLISITSLVCVVAIIISFYVHTSVSASQTTTFTLIGLWMLACGYFSNHSHSKHPHSKHTPPAHTQTAGTLTA